MKKTLLTLSFLSLLQSGAVLASDPAVDSPVAVTRSTATPLTFAQAPAATAALATRLPAPAAARVDVRPAPPTMQMAVIGIDDALLRGTNRRAERTDGRAGDPSPATVAGDGPSTLSGLAALLLMICILVGRRNRDTNV